MVRMYSVFILFCMGFISSLPAAAFETKDLTREQALAIAGDQAKHETQHFIGPGSLRHDRRVGFFPGLGYRVLVPGLDGSGGAGRKPGAQPQPVFGNVAGVQKR